MSTGHRNPGDPIDNLNIGTVIEVDGTHIVAELDAKVVELSRVYGGEVYPIGQFGSIIKVHFGRRLIYGYVSKLRMKSEYELERGAVQSAPSSSCRVVEADLFGEGEWVLAGEGGARKWELQFERGVQTFPLPQQRVYLTPRDELAFIFGKRQGAVLRLGEHVGTGSLPCYADLNELLGKHTAVLGSTGAGKSAAVAVILHEIIGYGSAKGYASWHPRIIMLDPHNEYGRAFPSGNRLSTDEGTLKLPYWLLSLQETVGLLIGKTEFVATSQANIIKTALLQSRQSGATRLALDQKGITVDSPMPYLLEDFEKAVEAQMPSQESKREPYNSVLHKLGVLKNDSRMSFMMEGWNGEKPDPFPGVAKQFLGEGPCARIVDLSGIPNEVAGAASAAIARMLFAMKVWQTPEERQKSPVLLVCEEAHRYVPNRGEALYEAAQDAVRRLAKEGRKYGIGLLLVSQRPSEVEATVLSQCNSWLVLRITNDADREQVRSILPDSLAGLTRILSGLRRREAIFVGEAAVLPARILIAHLDDDKLPKSQDIDFEAAWQNAPICDADLTALGQRWRYQQRA